jgi:hypothetical protein
VGSKGGSDPAIVSVNGQDNMILARSGIDVDRLAAEQDAEHLLIPAHADQPSAQRVTGACSSGA